VHPAALRALLLHALYRGPERRATARVSIGAPIRFRARLRQRPALLADLSLGGCRLLTTQSVAQSQRMKLYFPSELAQGKAFSIKARVLRVMPAEAAPDGTLAITADFQGLSSSSLAKLRAILAAHASGPARLAPDAATHAAAAAPDATPETCAALSAPKPGSARRERRSGARHAIERRVIALGDEATRVLMGRDISVGGMRVDVNPLLKIGESFRLAIHVNGLEVPLIVTAEVQRNDGDAGVALRFVEISSDAQRYLSETVQALPVVEPCEEGAERGYIVSEILDRQSA